ncbi:MAG TPA: Gfo/Idh/MocA family oxidoreductase, partial [Verrucomicrobiae bacterium]|nr:Gfo/Idh/MocA family oxidoreductase [Verrucomicrobiae bacterium]
MANADSDYGLSKQVCSASVAAPNLPYLPPVSRSFKPRIGLVGAGGVSEYHLRAYQQMGLDVVMICDVDGARAASRRDAFYPQAEVCTDYARLMQRDDIAVVDIALHPEHRAPVIQAAIQAGKHILSQKPFALDLDDALRMLDEADRRSLKIAVNQNGRWAPHFAYAREAVRAGLLGRIGSVDFNLAFDHSWTVGTHFENIHHLLLYDFGVHWFDLAGCLLAGQKPVSV